MTDKDPYQYKRVVLRICLGVIFTLLIILTGVALSSLGLHMVHKSTMEAANQLAERVSKTTEQATTHLEQPAYAIITSMSQSQLVNATNLEERLNYISFFCTALNTVPELTAIYMGYDTGDFFLVRSLNHITGPMLNAPPDAKYLMQSVEVTPQGSLVTFIFYDNFLNILKSTPATYNFDPRARPWYRAAQKSSEVITTEPYVFSTTQELGISLARKTLHGKSVIAADINLTAIADVLEMQLPTPSSRIAWMKPSGALISYVRGSSDGGCVEKNFIPELTSEGTPVLYKSFELYKSGQRDLLRNIESDDQEWFVFIKEITKGTTVQHILLLALPAEEVMRDASALLRQTVITAVLILAIAVPCIWLTARRIAQPLRLLSQQAKRIQEFNFDEEKPVNSYIEEISVLGHTIAQLRGSVQRFLNISMAISSEHNFTRLMECILSEMVGVANAEGGLLVLVDDGGEYIPGGSLCRTRSKEKKNCHYSAEYNFEEILPSIEDLKSKKAIRVKIDRDDPRCKNEIIEPFFRDPEVLHLDVIFVTLRNSGDETLGLLGLFKCIFAGKADFQANYTAFIETLAGTAAVALEHQRLLKAQQDLLNALIHIVAGAIDAKSPYTGGHCQRVPIIFTMLLEAACEAKDGPFRDFSMTDEEWEEAKLAGWLHDCGKVTTPEYIVDKATKLETIYDRIHEVRTRFEILKRDAEIACLNDIINGADALGRRQKLAEELQALDDDFAFVAKSNAGGEFMDQASLERLKVIAERTWTRTLDKRLGVSRDEKNRMGEQSETLPVSEPLLADKPEHIIPRPTIISNSDNDSTGFAVATPEALNNRGELYNLSISRGTLNNEERYKINEHTIQTITMLNNLPLPKYLKNVPEIAGGHHETMDGTGYPRKLTRDNLSLKARMVAIADIFEALTATDRPYKSSKTISEAMRIMTLMKDGNHIDHEAYELFMSAKIPQKYAERYLKPEQNDAE